MILIFRRFGLVGGTQLGDLIVGTVLSSLLIGYLGMWEDMMKHACVGFGLDFCLYCDWYSSWNFNVKI